MAKLMASAISIPTSLCSSSARKSTFSQLSYPKNTQFVVSTWLPQLGFTLFVPWCGLRHVGFSISRKYTPLERKRRCRGKVVYASLFGVGAPEALVIGVVALLVFGPKGLAEVARNLGKTLREFQPTIRELQEVSREFKSTLEREIGIDEMKSSVQNTYSPNKTQPISPPPPPVASTEDSAPVVDPNGTTATKTAYTSEEYLKITEEQLKAAAAQKVEPMSPPETQFEPQTPKQVADGTSAPKRAYTSEEYLKITEEQLKEAAAQKLELMSPPETQFEPQTPKQATIEPTAVATPPPKEAESGT